MFIAGCLILGLMVLAFFASKWGVDSRDDVNSLEWERRQQWFKHL